MMTSRYYMTYERARMSSVSRDSQHAVPPATEDAPTVFCRGQRHLVTVFCALYKSAFTHGSTGATTVCVVGVRGHPKNSGCGTRHPQIMVYHERSWWSVNLFNTAACHHSPCRDLFSPQNALKPFGGRTHWGAHSAPSDPVRTPSLPESAWPFSRRSCLSTHLSESAK